MTADLSEVVAYHEYRPVEGAGFWGGLFFVDVDVAGAAIVALEAALEHALSWEGLLEFIDHTYPAETFTGESGDPGPRFIVLLRELKQAEAALAERDRLLAYVTRISPITVNRCREDLADRDRAEEGGE